MIEQIPAEDRALESPITSPLSPVGNTGLKACRYQKEPKGLLEVLQATWPVSRPAPAEKSSRALLSPAQRQYLPDPEFIKQDKLHPLS